MTVLPRIVEPGAASELIDDAGNGSSLASFSDRRIVHVVRQYARMVGGLEDFVRNLVARKKGRFASLRVLTLGRLFTGPDRRLSQDGTRHC
ncbi:hypothetical protein [uncultured Roseibium sp.]|uniref:hypothetical protein n=1 Tax=uncultured Roseibium sp. TaxID=1936171 RepID=UPI0032178EC5